ncbi:MAG: DUF5076 domain-containing protein [Janthinobacterium lividum]
MSQKDALRIPAAAMKDPRSLEILRVWVANGEQHVALSFGMWEEASSWGVLLADLARHIAEAHAQHDETIDPEDFMEGIRSGMESELDGEEEEGEIEGSVQ